MLADIMNLIVVHLLLDQLINLDTLKETLRN